jgi:F0F1-type ATP synthase membrane subunit b/b'
LAAAKQPVPTVLAEVAQRADAKALKQAKVAARRAGATAEEGGEEEEVRLQQVLNREKQRAQQQAKAEKGRANSNKKGKGSGGGGGKGKGGKEGGRR